MAKVYFDAGFPEKLRELMKEHGVSQRELGEEIGAAQSAVSAWLRGEHKPRPETVKALAQYFGVRPEELDVGVVVSAGEELYTKEEVKEVIRTVFDCYFLTVDAYDQYNENPLSFMTAMESLFYGGTVGRNELDVKVVRALDLATPTFRRLGTYD